MKKIFREPASGLSHFAAALLSAAALFALLYTAINNGDAWEIVSFSIFGVSMLLLYAASAAYHLFNGSEKLVRVLRKIDHSMIFVLIAGTYTPVCLTLLRGATGYVLLSVVWACAIAGIAIKIFFFDMPRSLCTGIYITMGWAAVCAVVPLYRAAGAQALLWLLAGGALYTAGGVIYALKRPNPIPSWLGFHEIFHFFVILGSASHFFMIIKFC